MTHTRKHPFTTAFRFFSPRQKRAVKQKIKQKNKGIKHVRCLDLDETHKLLGRTNAEWEL